MVSVLSVLPVLSVYLAVSGLSLLLAHRFVTKISRATAIFLLAVPLVVTGKAVFTGGIYAPLDIAYEALPLAGAAQTAGIGNPQTPILGDVVSQEIPWRKAVREAVKNRRLPLWNRFILAGEPLLATQQPAIFHPFTWAGMPLSLAHAWTLEMTLGVFLALAGGFLFFLDLALSPVASAIGAIGWAFCDYLIFWAGYPLTPGAAPFPLLLLGLRRLARDRDARAVGITTGALVLITVAGHSETLLHAVAAGGLWFLYCLAADARGARIRALALSLVAGALALGLTAVVLLPHVEALPHTVEYFTRSTWYAHVHKSRPLGEAIGRLQEVFLPYAFGISGHGNSPAGQSGYSNAYAGALLFPFAMLGFLSRNRLRWFFLGIAVLGFSVWAAIPGITDFVSALPLLDIAINERLVFLGCFGLAALAALGAEDLLRGRHRAAFGAAIALTLAGLAGGYALVFPRLTALAMPPADRRLVFALQAVPLAAAGLFWLFWLLRRRRNSQAALLVLAGILLAERGAETFSVYPVAPDRAFYPRLEVLDRIPRGEPWRMTSLGFTFIPNISALYEIEDVRGYEAMTFLPLFQTYPLWCVHQPVWFNRVDDPTRPFLAFLNVRWVVAPPGYAAPPGWKTVADTPSGSLIENPRALPRAFVPREVNVEPDPMRQLLLLGDIPDFAARGVVAAVPGHAPGTRFQNPETKAGAAGNGAATVAIRTYEAQRMVLDVDAPAGALVGTSVTGWPGWRLTVDGKPAELLEFNRAFLAFAVSSGRHTAVLRYFPRSFAIGAAISAGTVLFLALFALFALFGAVRRRDAPRPPEKSAAAATIATAP